MDFVDRIVEHDVWFTRRLLDRATTLPDEALDRRVLQGATLFATDGTTLRRLLTEMVTTKENWAGTLTGRSPADGRDDTPEGLSRRLDVAGAAFASAVKGIRDRGEWDAGFVDALCDPPESFTYGGMLAHVTTFSAWRRTLAVLAFRQLGVDDLGIGDPLEWERSPA
jgi:uncharacterized damage-inducible protein DinB